MRHLLAASFALAAVFAVTACNSPPSGTTNTSTGSGTTGVGGEASSTGTASSGTSGGGTSGGSTGVGTSGGTGGGSTGNDCGTDTCSACPGGYVPNDSCLNGSWQCGCALPPTGGNTSGGGTGAGNSGGATSGSTAGSPCGPDTCGPCPPGCSASDSCQKSGRWSCVCGCGGIGGNPGGNTGSGIGGGTSGGTVPCNLDGGAPTLVGSWSGNTSFSEMFGRMGGGGGGPDTATVVATDGGVEFQAFGAQVLPNCTLPFTLTNATSATLVPGTVCADSSNGNWTFQGGTATLDSTGCIMTAVTSGAVVDPGTGAGTFTTSSTLDLQ